MKTLVFILVIAAVAIVWHRMRMGRLQASGKTLGLTVSDGPASDQREPWMALSAWVHDRVPTAWGTNAEGLIEGHRLQLQEQQLRSSIGAQPVWHVLVVWTLERVALPSFRLSLEQSPGALGRMGAAITAPLSAHFAEREGVDEFQVVSLDSVGADGWVLHALDPVKAQAWWSNVPIEAFDDLKYVKALGGEGDQLVALMEGQMNSVELDVLVKRCTALLPFAKAALVS